MPAFALSFSNSWTAVVLQASWVCRCTYYVVNNDFAIVSTYLMIFCVEGFTSLLTNASLNKNFFVKTGCWYIILKFYYSKIYIWLEYWIFTLYSFRQLRDYLQFLWHSFAIGQSFLHVLHSNLEIRSRSIYYSIY